MTGRGQHGGGQRTGVSGGGTEVNGAEGQVDRFTLTSVNVTDQIRSSYTSLHFNNGLIAPLFHNVTAKHGFKLSPHNIHKKREASTVSDYTFRYVWMTEICICGQPLFIHKPII